MIFPTFVLIVTQTDSEGRWNVDISSQAASCTLPNLDKCDVDKSYVIRVSDSDEYHAIRQVIKSRFWEYNVCRRDYPHVWRRSYEKQGSNVPFVRCFVGHDEAGHSMARQMLDFVFENRVTLGDDGDWHLWTFRELFLRRPGVNFTDLAHEEVKKSIVVKPLPNADYTDELESFRFPSVSCLYGVSQPLAQLRGAVKFRQLFIQDGAGVYIAFDANSVLYVGMSQQFSQRLCNAASHHKLKIIMERHPEARVAVIHYPDWKMTELDEIVTDAELNSALTRMRELLLAFERACIEHYQPRYNGRLAEGNGPDEAIS